MAKHKQKKDPLMEALHAGEPYTWTIPEGGNLASMRKAIRHGQTLTMSPISDPSEIQKGDLVLVKWHQGDLFHMVGDIQGDQYLIVNSMGGVNGWVGADKILGRVTKVVEPEPRPEVEEMLGQLETAFERLITEEKAGEAEAGQLRDIVRDLRWYAVRLGTERLDEMPRANKWSFAQNLWWLTRRARQREAPVPERALYFIDCGKRIVGYGSEILALLEYGEAW